MSTRTLLVILACFFLESTAAPARIAAHSSTLARVLAQHQLACGIVQEDAEYSTEDDHATRGAFDERVCEAIAAAVAPGTRVVTTSFLDEVSAVAALRTHRIDVIATLSADPAHTYAGVALSRPVFDDALALLVPVAGGAQRPGDLAGKKICVLAETGNEDRLRFWYAQHRIDYLPFPFQEEGEMEAAYATTNCAALAAERTRLLLVLASFGSVGSQHRILPQDLSHDPMAIAARASDVQWVALLKAVALQFPAARAQ